MIEYVIVQDPLEYLKDKSGVVFNHVEPDQSYRIGGENIPMTTLEDTIEYLEKGTTVYIPFANTFIMQGQEINRQFLSFIIRFYNKLQKGKLILVANVKAIPREIEQYIVMEEVPPPSEEKIKEVLLETFRDRFGRSPEPSEQKEIEHLSKRLTGLTEAEVRNIAMQSIEKFGKISEGFMLKAKLVNIKKRTDLEYDEPAIKLEDIGGNEIIKRYIQVMKETMTEEAVEFGIKPPKGLLLLGPQGTAKSTIPKAMANFFGIPYVKFSTGAFMSKYYGETERQLYKVLKTIDAIGRCVVHIDEVDKVLKKTVEGHETTSRIGGMLMEWMADKSTMTPVVMTGNYIENIDTDFTRAGRVDTIFWTWFPKAEEREEIWKIHLKKVGRDPKLFDLNKLIAESRFYTGSEIETAVQIALRAAFSKKKELDTETLIHVLKKTIVPVYFKEQEKFRQLYESLKPFIPASSMENSDTIPQETKTRKIAI